VSGWCARSPRAFPAAADAPLTHHWGGPLAVPRDWSMAIAFDRASGIGFAGGYTGHGVAVANVSGRTLADLVLGRDSDLTRMPWVGHRSRGWEPEPIRFLASTAIVRMLGAADRHEDATGRPARRVAPAATVPAAALRANRTRAVRRSAPVTVAEAEVYATTQRAPA